jgi:hypothetical protein
VGLAELISSFRADRKIKKLLRNASEHTLPDVRESTFVRVTGTVQPHRSRLLEAPLSGRLCSYYSLVIRAPVRSWSLSTRRQHDRYMTLGEEQEGIPFELDVEGVRAVIDPTDAWISSGFDHKVYLHDDDERALEIWKRRGLVGTAAYARFEEAVLAVGERIAVFGAAMREPDRDGSPGETGYRDGGPTRLRFSGSERFPLVIRDDLRSL